MSSLNALMASPSQRVAGATLSLSSPVSDHQSNYYDVLRGDDAYEPRPSSYERPRTTTTTTLVCCDDDNGYLTPAPVSSDRWTTSMIDSSYDRISHERDACSGYQYQPINDSCGKYLTLQGSVYYEYI